MEIDLAAEFNRAVEKIPGAVPAVLKIDMGAVAVALATAWAEDMRENLQRGLRPDGKGPMPMVKEGGRHRGQGTATVASIKLVWSKGSNRMAIAASEDTRGTLKRILRGIPFRPPLTSERIREVQAKYGAIATGGLQATAQSIRGRTYSSRRLADWRAWQAKKTAKAASSGLGGNTGSLGGMLK